MVKTINFQIKRTFMSVLFTKLSRREPLQFQVSTADIYFFKINDA